MIRDRFEKLINAVSTGKALTETRSRFEEVINAIAEKIGELEKGSGSGSVSRTLLGSFSEVSATYEVANMSEYSMIIVEFSKSDSFGGYSGLFTHETITSYELNKIVTSSYTSSAASANILCGFVMTSATTLARLSFDNSTYISRVWGVK